MRTAADGLGDDGKVGILAPLIKIGDDNDGVEDRAALNTDRFKRIKAIEPDGRIGRGISTG